MHKHKLKLQASTRSVLKFHCKCGVAYVIQRFTWRTLLSGTYTRLGIISNNGRR